MTTQTTKTLMLATIIALGGASLAFAAGGPRGGMDRTEMRAQMFERLDSDGDGRFTREEVEAQGIARFGEADANGDGLLSEQELRDAAAARAAERSERMAARMLERFDANGDGALSQEELSARESRHGGKLFERVDADGDGVVTRSEFMAAEMPRGGHGWR